MSENKADQLRAEMRGRHAAELAAPGWKGLHNEPNRHRARGDMDAWCDWCGDCAEDQPCRCCLAVEVEALRDQNAELLATLTELAPLSHKVRAEKAEAQVQKVRRLTFEWAQNSTCPPWRRINAIRNILDGER